MCENCGIENCSCGITILKGEAGTSSQLYIAYANDTSGSGFSLTDGSLPFMAFLAADPLYTPVQADFSGLWFAKGQGVFGGNSDDYLFNTALSGDPAAGKLLFDNANISVATFINISETDASSANVAAWLTALATSNATIKGLVRVGNKATSTKFALFAVTAVTNHSGYKTITVTYLASSSNSPFVSGDPLVFSYVISGNNGDAGTDARETLFNDLSQTASGSHAGDTLTVSHNIPANTFVSNGDSACIEIILQGTGLSLLNTTQSFIKIDAVQTQSTIWGTTATTVFKFDISLDKKDATHYVLSYSINGVPAASQTITVADFTSAIAVEWWAKGLIVAGNGQVTCTKFFAEYKPA